MLNTYIPQLEQRINLLISERKFREAYNLCREALDKFSEEKTFLKLKSKIEEMVRDENIRIVGDKITQLESLNSEKKYAEVLRISRETLKLSPGNKKILKLEERAQKAYKEEVEKMREDFCTTQVARLTKILNENPAILPDELFLLESNNQRDPAVFSLTQQFRNKLIGKKIAEKQELIHSNKYDVIQSFVEQLRKIDQKNPQITKIVELVAARKHDEQSNATKEFVYKGEKYLDTMMQLEKYEKVMQAAREILSVEKNNTVVQEIYKKAQIKLYLQTRDTVVELINSNKSTLWEDYQQNRNKFIKL